MNSRDAPVVRRNRASSHWTALITATRLARSASAISIAFIRLIRGAAGMIAQPEGYLREVSKIIRADGALLIADEVMTGFGRTGRLFACSKESVQPDLLALAKGMTGGYLPMAATLATQRIFDA